MRILDLNRYKLYKKIWEKLNNPNNCLIAFEVYWYMTKIRNIQKAHFWKML